MNLLKLVLIAVLASLSFSCGQITDSEDKGRTVYVEPEDGESMPEMSPPPSTQAEGNEPGELEPVEMNAPVDETNLSEEPNANESPEPWMPPPAIIGYDFGSPEAWSRPIDDVLNAGELMFGDNFSRGIGELVSDQGRLWIGYGDANVNLGGVYPITFRSFVSATDPEPEIGPISGEEQLDQFRFLDGQLWMPGVDSLGTDEQVHFPNIGGNIYTYGEMGWEKHRTVPGGEHVHDVAWWNDAAWAVGSGADNRPEFETGQIHRYLWRSLDRGVSWMTIHRDPFPNPGSGDTRYVHLLPQEEGLYLFGYEYDWEAGQMRVANARFDGWELHPLSEDEQLHLIFGIGTLPLRQDMALLWGVNVRRSPLRNETWIVRGGKRRPLDFMTGRTIIDTTLRQDTGEVLILSYLGDEYGTTPETMNLTVHLISIDDMTSSRELLNWTAESAPLSVAFFAGSLFLGTSDGAVLKSTGTLRDEASE